MLPPSLPKYAHADKSNTYHLTASKGKTFCGLSFLPVLLANNVNAPLHLVNNVPATFSLCKHCKRAQQQVQGCRN